MRFRPNKVKVLVTLGFVLLFALVLAAGLFFTGQRPGWMVVLGAALIVAYIYVKISVFESRTRG